MVPKLWKGRNAMKTNTRNNVPQSVGASNLPPAQRQLLSFFNSMNADAQEFIVRVAENHARVFPRERPQLRMIAGGAA